MIFEKIKIMISHYIFEHILDNNTCKLQLLIFLIFKGNLVIFEGIIDKNKI
jgi:hypothetical protein